MLQYVMLSKIVTEEQILHDSTYMSCLRWSNSWKQRREQWLPGTERRGKWGVANQQV